MTAARCAFERCQAGGDILAGAPRVFEDWKGDFTLRDGTPSQSYQAAYHPGCHAAEHRQAGDFGEPPFDEGPTVTLSAIGGLVETVAACACVDRHGLPCQGVAGPEGLCSSCRSHANPAPVEVFT